jgi:hypothetical protein
MNDVTLELYNCGDERVTYYKGDYTCIAIVNDNHFKTGDLSSGLEKWWTTPLGEHIVFSLFKSKSFELGVFIYDGEKYNNCHNMAVHNICRFKLQKIFTIIRERYKDCHDGVLTLTNCLSCNGIIKIGNPIGNMKCSIAGTHMCDICLYA